MKIYQLKKERESRIERKIVSSELSGLKKAAGGEDILTLTDEAINCFRRDSNIRDGHQYLKNLALKHINDHSQILEGIENDPEFVMAERLSLLAELVIRVAPSAKGKYIYKRVSSFVVEQLTDKVN